MKVRLAYLGPSSTERTKPYLVVFFLANNNLKLGEKRGKVGTLFRLWLKKWIKERDGNPKRLWQNKLSSFAGIPASVPSPTITCRVILVLCVHLLYLLYSLTFFKMKINKHKSGYKKKEDKNNYKWMEKMPMFCIRVHQKVWQCFSRVQIILKCVKNKGRKEPSWKWKNVTSTVT